MATAKVGCITQNIDLGYACFQEKYYNVLCMRVCIARAAVNESVRIPMLSTCMQFATLQLQQILFRLELS